MSAVVVTPDDGERFMIPGGSAPAQRTRCRSSKPGSIKQTGVDQANRVAVIYA